jgi:hypothetical protein
MDAVCLRTSSPAHTVQEAADSSRSGLLLLLHVEKRRNNASSKGLNGSSRPNRDSFSPSRTAVTLLMQRSGMGRNALYVVGRGGDEEGKGICDAPRYSPFSFLEDAIEAAGSAPELEAGRQVWRVGLRRKAATNAGAAGGDRRRRNGERRAAIISTRGRSMCFVLTSQERQMRFTLD